MTKIEKSVIDFLKSGMVYSDGAIMKNLGINDIELENIYASLMKKGYLETYEDFLRNNPDYNENKKSSCSACSSSKSCSSKGGCSSGSCGSDSDIDYSKVKVLTEKSFIYTY